MDTTILAPMEIEQVTEWQPLSAICFRCANEAQSPVELGSGHYCQPCAALYAETHEEVMS